MRRRSIAAALAFLLAATAPGPAAYQAVAATFEGEKPIELPVIDAALTPASAFTPIPVANVVEGIKVDPLIPQTVLPELPASAIERAAAAVQTAQGGLAVATVQALRITGQTLAAAKTDGQARAAIETLFTGAKTSVVSGDGVVLGFESAGAPALSRFSVAELKDVASGGHFSPSTRASAVKAIADRSSDPARLALREIGAFDENATGADYEVKRLALRALKAQTHDDSITMPAMGAAHQREKLAVIAHSKPVAVAYDWHETWETDNASKETAEAIAGHSKAGVETMILTGGPARDTARGGDSIFNQLAPISPEQKANLSVGSDLGAEIWAFDRAGQRQLVQRLPGWTADEKSALAQAGLAVRMAHGIGRYHDLKTIQSEYEHVIYLPDSISDEALTNAATAIKTFLKEKGWRDARAAARRRSGDEPTRLIIAKYDKSIGTSFLINRREAFERLRDANRLLPRILAKLAVPILKRLPSRPLDSTKVLVVGDSFDGTRDVDGPMLKGAPGATALAVGGRANPDYDNVFVMRERGHAATLAVARAINTPVVKTADELAQEKKEQVDVKATVGWTASSVVTIAAYVLVALAHPLIAQHALGGAGLALVMALGPIFTILTGPLNGRLTDKLTMRHGMLLNAYLRALFLLAMPLFLFGFFGGINIWTLAVGAMANGWILSGIQAGENAYMKGIGGEKNVGTLLSFARSRYLVIQVVLNLLVGVGGWVDQWNRVFPAAAFLIAAAAHVVLVAPIVRLTIPNRHLNYRETGDPESAEGFLAAGRRWAKTGLRAFIRAAVAAVRDLIAQVRTGGLAKSAGLAVTLPARELASAIRKIKREHVLMALALAAFAAAHAVPAAALAAVVPAVPALLIAVKFLHVVLSSPMPLAASIFYWIMRRPDTAAVLSKPALRMSVLLIMLAVAMLYPIQYVGLPMIAVGIAGQAGKGLLLSSLLGAMFFGQLIASGSHTKLPELRLPFIGRFGAEQIIQKLVLVLAAIWVGTRLMPHNLLAEAAAVAVGYVLTRFVARVSDRNAVKFFGVGLAAGLAVMALGYHFLALQVPLQFLGLLTIGLFYGLGFLALNKYQQTSAGDAPLGAVSGVNGAGLNSGISLSYSAMSLLTLLMVFPHLFVPMGVFFAIGAAVFFLAPGRMPGLNRTVR